MRFAPMTVPCWCVLGTALLLTGCSGQDPAPEPSSDTGLMSDSGVQFNDQDGGALGVCGDGVVEASEGCDDGDLTSGDGCSAACQQEEGWTCTLSEDGTGSECVTRCGDRVTAGQETCDDGNQIDGDGCSSTCQEEEAPGCGEGGECLFELGDWGDFGACSNTCGAGTHTRTRPCIREDGQEAPCASCGGGECEQTEPCEDFSGCTYSYGDWVVTGTCQTGGFGQKTLTRSCLRSDGAEVSCTLCGGECEQTEPCCPTGFNIGGGDEQWCNGALQDKRNECLAAGCALTAPTACAYGSSGSCTNCWYAQGTCVCAGNEGPWCD